MRNKEFNPGPFLLNNPTYTSGHRSRSAPHFKNEKYAPGTVGNWTGNLIGQLITNHPKHGNNHFSLAQIFKGGPELYVKGSDLALTNASYRTRMVQISERKMWCPSSRQTPTSQGRSNGKKSSGAYNQYESFDMIKIAMILHFPPIIENFNTPMNKLPYFPGADCLAKMRAGCSFYENGHCIPVNLYLLQNEGPSKTLRFAIEPLKEFEEMKPANLKGAVAAAATYRQLPQSQLGDRENCAIDHFWHRTCSRHLSAAGSNQQQP
jgi:hypothetical protein